MDTEGEKRTRGESLQGAVCVIDGDQGIRNSLYMLLATLGVRVVTFSDSEEFLDALGGERPAFLIAELDLPGMGGFDLKRTLNDRGLHLPTIGLTCESDRGKRSRASALGFLDLVEKPFVYWSVVDRVQQIVGSGRASSHSGGDGHAHHHPML